MKKLLKPLLFRSKLASSGNPAKNISILSEALNPHAQVGVVVASRRERHAIDEIVLPDSRIETRPRFHAPTFNIFGDMIRENWNVSQKFPIYGIRFERWVLEICPPKPVSWLVEGIDHLRKIFL